MGSESLREKNDRLIAEHAARVVAAAEEKAAKAAAAEAGTDTDAAPAEVVKAPSAKKAKK